MQAANFRNTLHKERDTMTQVHDCWQQGFDLAVKEQQSGLDARHFQGECEDYVRGYMQGYATACWHAVQDLQAASEDYLTPAEYRREGRFDSVAMWDEASTADDDFYASAAEWAQMGS